MKEILKLFFTFLKIGATTYGGGYAMIGIMEKEIVDKKKYLDLESYLDILTVCQSLPGPLAITSTAFIGYKINKFVGAIVSLLGTLIPSFIIIFLVATVFTKFESNIFVQHALQGIKAVVPVLVFIAVIKFWKRLDKNVHNIVFALVVLFALEFLKINPALIIIFSAIYGILVYGIKDRKGGVK
ncbi:chromate transporter [Clostridium thermobutyricum]|uniref:Putative chromate transport protein n=1 Tax=Clostridium thermobutyricum DSM 4928 TaxID=1121339 RepID=A0A1V4SX82_9CLOT|nr:chromate transporter [Clostridium thermobutyricum]OPX49182.1 putative chromate transport protein [Clostridium thermobutyricum DSM 4928]